MCVCKDVFLRSVGISVEVEWKRHVIRRVSDTRTRTDSGGVYEWQGSLAGAYMKGKEPAMSKIGAVHLGLQQQGLSSNAASAASIAQVSRHLSCVVAHSLLQILLLPRITLVLRYVTQNVLCGWDFRFREKPKEKVSLIDRLIHTMSLSQAWQRRKQADRSDHTTKCRSVFR